MFGWRAFRENTLLTRPVSTAYTPETMQDAPRQPASHAAHRLRLWLAERGVSQSALAREMGCPSRQYITDYVYGRRRMPLDQAAWLEDRTCGWVRAVDWVEPFRGAVAHCDPSEGIA